MTAIVKKTIELEVVLLLNKDGSIYRVELPNGTTLFECVKKGYSLEEGLAAYVEATKPVAGKVRVWRKDGVLVYRTHVRSTKQHHILSATTHGKVCEWKHRRVGGQETGEKSAWSGHDRIHEEDLRLLNQQ